MDRAGWLESASSIKSWLLFVSFASLLTQESSRSFASWKFMSEQLCNYGASSKAALPITK